MTINSLEDLGKEDKKKIIQPKVERDDKGNQQLNKIIVGSKIALKEIERFIKQNDLDAYVCYTVEACAKMTGANEQTIRSWMNGSRRAHNQWELPNLVLPTVWIAFDDLVGYLNTRSKKYTSYGVEDLHFLRDINSYFNRPDVKLRLKIKEENEK